MIVVVVFEEDVLRLICGYTPQSGRCLEEKQSSYDELKCEWDIHSTGDLIMCLGKINSHVSMHIDGFDGVHGGWWWWCRSEEYRRKNVIRVLSG